MAAKLTKKATESLTRPLRSQLVVPLVFIASLCLTVVTYFNARETIVLEEEHRLEQTRLELEAQLSHRFQVYADLIEQTRGLLLSQPELTPDEWRVYAESVQIQKRYPGIQAVAFVRNISKSEINRLTARVRNFKGYEEFAVWPTPSKDTDVLAPVTMIEPMNWRNKRAIGFDMMSEAIRRQTMERAKTTNATQLSDIITLVQETDDKPQPGLVLFSPVFKRGAKLDTPEARDEALVGYVSAVFRSHDLIKATLRSTNYYSRIQDTVDIEFYLGDRSNITASRLLYDSDPVMRSGIAQLSTDLRRELSFTVGGRQITAFMHVLPGFYSTSQYFLPSTILLVGLCLTILLTRILHVNNQQAEKLRKSERQLRLVTDALPVLISYIDKKLIYRFNNYAYEAWFGSSRERLNGKPVSEVLGSQNFALVERAIRSALTGRTSEVEVQLATLNGETRSCRATYIPDFAVNGEVKGVVGLVTDISERKRAEERMDLMVNATTMLHGSLEAEPTLTRFSQTLVPRLADWVSVHLLENEDRLERIASVHRNPDKASLMVDIDRQFSHGKYSENPAWQALQSGEPKLIRYMDREIISNIARSDEHLRALQAIGFASLMCIPLISRGRTLGLILMGRANPATPFDIADLKFAVELSQRASLAVDNVRLYRETQLANRSKDEFLATVSHELRTPMNVILGWLEILRNERPDSATMDVALQTLDRNARVQVELINDLLDVSRIISGKMTIAPQPISVPGIVDLAVDSILPAAKAKDLVVERNIGTDLPLVNADPDRLQQVLWNLLTNAVKFTPNGGRIEVGVREEGRDLVIQVRDSGIGIEPRFLPFVFERFRQEDGSITRQHGGLGIGLALVRYLIEAHGGHVSVESQGKGFGSTFTIRLPTGGVSTVVSRSQQAGTQPSRKTYATDTEKAPAKSLDGIEVMLVDDSPDVRVLLERILKKAGAKVHSYASAPEALTALDSIQPDVLVSDIGLPEMDGYSFIREIRNREVNLRRRYLPAAALTAFAQARDADQAIRSGFDKHIAKPVSADELVKSVKQLAQVQAVPQANVTRPPEPTI